jgi:uncharacterized damage-inducible protein DinB
VNAIDVLRSSSEVAYAELLQSIDGVDQHQSWATVQLIEGEYLHSAGSIIGIVQHIAGGDMLHGSFGFRNEELRGRDLVERMRQIGPDWDKTKAFLDEAHAYWMDSWSNLTDADLELPRGTTWIQKYPAWQIIARVIHHDEYHAGQIHLLRATLKPTTTPADMHYDEEEKYGREHPTW